jgi:hypothetical protein
MCHLTQKKILSFHQPFFLCSSAAARSLFFCTLVPVTVFCIASVVHVCLYATGHLTSLAQSPARRLLSRECAENIFIDVERARATQLLSSPLAPAHWSAMRSHSSALLAPLLQASDLDKRFGNSFVSLPPASIESLSVFAEPGSGAKRLSASRCSDDDMFLRFLRLHTNAIATQWSLPDAALTFLELPPAYVPPSLEFNMIWMSHFAPVAAMSQAVSKGFLRMSLSLVTSCQTSHLVG